MKTQVYETIGKVIKTAKNEVIISVSILMFIIFISAIIMYNAENRIQPDAFPSVFASLKWAIATYTTTGLSEIYPLTIIGKIFASIIGISEMGLFAFPVGIICSEFIWELGNKYIYNYPKGHKE